MYVYHEHSIVNVHGILCKNLNLTISLAKIGRNCVIAHCWNHNFLLRQWKFIHSSVYASLQPNRANPSQFCDNIIEIIISELRFSHDLSQTLQLLIEIIKPRRNFQKSNISKALLTSNTVIKPRIPSNP